jgi:hypothetical protein
MLLAVPLCDIVDMETQWTYYNAERNWFSIPLPNCTKKKRGGDVKFLDGS